MGHLCSMQSQSTLCACGLTEKEKQIILKYRYLEWVMLCNCASFSINCVRVSYDPCIEILKKQQHTFNGEWT